MLEDFIYKHGLDMILLQEVTDVTYEDTMFTSISGLMAGGLPFWQRNAMN
jgi:hypothetical protein